MRKLALVAAALLLLARFSFPAFSAPAAPSGREKRIALTFDDGPHPYRTDRLLSLLARYEVRATFFVIGRNVELYPQVLKRVVAAGHEIGNHTYSHLKMKKADCTSIAAELEKTAALTEQVAGVRPTLFRPPEGVRSSAVTAAAQREGLSLVLWTIDTRDWAHASASRIEREILSGAADGAIILCHDYTTGEWGTPAGLERAIPALLAQGYRFVTVSELLQ